VSQTREELHELAASIVRQLVQRFGQHLPPDAETTVRYYIGCLNSSDRAAEHVLQLRGLTRLGKEGG
jgi:hypothetical protein